MSVDDLLYRRFLCGQKAYCFLMNTDFSRWPREATEKYMRRALAFGMFPGFFSADASTGHYFKNPDLYERDRALFRTYLPLISRIAEAGWEAVPMVIADDEAVIAQRFGEEPGSQYFTLFNSAAEPKTATLTFDERLGLGGETVLTELLSGQAHTVKNRQLTVEIPPETTLLFQR